MFHYLCNHCYGSFTKGFLPCVIIAWMVLYLIERDSLILGVGIRSSSINCAMDSCYINYSYFGECEAIICLVVGSGANPPVAGRKVGDPKRDHLRQRELSRACSACGHVYFPHSLGHFNPPIITASITYLCTFICEWVLIC